MAFFEALKSKAKTQSKTVTAGTNATTVVPDSGYEGLSEVIVNPTPSQEKTITPSLSSQTVTPDSGKLLSRVTVNAYSPTGNASTSDVLSGKTFMNSNGAQTGSMTNNGAVSGTATASQPYTIPEGYHNGQGVVTASGGGVNKIQSDYACATGSYPQTTIIDCSNIPNYQSLTVDNFIVVPKTGTAYNSQGNTASWNSTNAGYIEGYNSSTGALSYRNGWQSERTSFRIATIDVYLIS